MKEALFVAIRFIVLIFALLAHIVKFLWSAVVILPISLTDSWIGKMSGCSLYDKGILKYCLETVFEGDAIYTLIKWILGNE